MSRGRPPQRGDRIGDLRVIAALSKQGSDDVLLVGHSEYRGKGLVPEAAWAVIEAAFSTLPELNRIWAFADVRQLASTRVMEKLGMQREGVLREHDVRRGELVDRAVYGLLRVEWAASPKR